MLQNRVQNIGRKVHYYDSRNTQLTKNKRTILTDCSNFLFPRSEIREKRFLQNYLQQQHQTDEEELANANENQPHRKQEQNFCSIFIYTDPFLWKQVLQIEGKKLAEIFKPELNQRLSTIFILLYLSGRNEKGCQRNNEKGLCESKGICLVPEEILCGRSILLILQLTI